MFEIFSCLKYFHVLLWSWPALSLLGLAVSVSAQICHRVEHSHWSRSHDILCSDWSESWCSLMPWRHSSRHPKPPARVISCLLYFALSLWHKVSFHAGKGSIMGSGVSNIMIPPIVDSVYHRLFMWLPDLECSTLLCQQQSGVERGYRGSKTASSPGPGEGEREGERSAVKVLMSSPAQPGLILLYIF